MTAPGTARSASSVRVSGARPRFRLTDGGEDDVGRRVHGDPVPLDDVVDRHQFVQEHYLS